MTIFYDEKFETMPREQLAELQLQKLQELNFVMPTTINMACGMYQ